MKKVMVIVLAAALAIFVESWPGLVEQTAYAAPDGGRGRGGGRFEGRGGGGRFDGRGGGRFDGRGFDGRHGGFGGHHGGGRFDIWFGPGWWGWDPFFYPYYYPYYPYYSAPPVVIQQQPQEYVLPEPQAEQSYWYYCREAKGYYPYVKRCPGGWMKVVPAPAPTDQEE